MPACKRETDGWLSSSSQVGRRPTSSPSEMTVAGSSCKSSRTMMNVASISGRSRLKGHQETICHLRFEICHLVFAKRRRFAKSKPGTNDTIRNPRSQISDLRSQISNLKSQISDLKSQISNFRSQVSNNRLHLTWKKTTCTICTIINASVTEVEMTWGATHIFSIRCR